MRSLRNISSRVLEEMTIKSNLNLWRIGVTYMPNDCNYSKMNNFRKRSKKMDWKNNAGEMPQKCYWEWEESITIEHLRGKSGATLILLLWKWTYLWRLATSTLMILLKIILHIYFSSAHVVKEMGREELYTGGVLMLRIVLIHLLWINFISAELPDYYLKCNM